MWTTYEVNNLKGDSIKTEHAGTPPPPPTSLSVEDKKGLLARFIEENLASLLRTLCIYLHRAGLAYGATLQDEAQELLQAVTEHALESAERFDNNRRPMAWLLGIASNLILQEKQKRARHARREPLLNDLHPTQDPYSDLLPNSLLEPSTRFDDLFHSQQAYLNMTAQLSEQDQELLHLSVIQQYSAKEIAERLQCSPGTVRVRLFRALKRLRENMGS
ncbi:MAG: RNA polymerase sigma factor [Myxococcales bacterium]|nr:RNA polymerase sigma factor [Myxococcales bacterium]